jgi:L-asparaginase
LIISIYSVGGTIDKVYYDQMDDYEIGEPKVGEILEEAGVDFDYQVHSLMKKDSLDMTEEDLRRIHRHIRDDPNPLILITHGTDTMVRTACHLFDIPGKTIVLTGAMQPARFRTSDAVFNVGFAAAAVQTLSSGVYLAMNGRVFEPDKVQKNRDTKRFEPLP